MRVEIITPALAPGLYGNLLTARRYARLLSRLGLQVSIKGCYTGEDCDLLIALHARRSLDSIRRFHQLKPQHPLILVLTGTDLYRDIKRHRGAQSALEMATRLVVLQEMGMRELPGRLHPKTRIIYQSAERIRARVRPPSTYFRVCNIANLRAEKDPFRTALAARRLAPSSRIRVLHIGRAFNGQMKRRALQENAHNLRYRWVGEQLHWKTRRILAASHLLALTSRIEGSSNALCEALASAVPVIASKIPGLMGSLGKDYPGYFPPGDTRALAELLGRAESDRSFYTELKTRCRKLSRLVSPRREYESWKDLLSTL